jgi:hypothetical protein
MLSPEFFTNYKPDGTVLSTAAEKLKQPIVGYKYGTTSIKYPILSPPAIAYNGGTRYVYTVNSNALWRYNTTQPSDFITSANGAEVAFSKTSQGQAAGSNIFAYASPTASFQFNSTPPLVTFANKIYTIDIQATSATKFTYALNRLEGKLNPTDPNMWAAGVGLGKQIASNVTSSDAELDNAGIYLSANTALNEGFFGLADGKIYRLAIR